MTVGGSQQLRIYRRAIRDGATMMTACATSGIALSEARLIDAEDRRNPPPEECFELLQTTPAPACAPPQKDDDMGRPRKKDTGIINGEVPKPDFALAVKLFRDEIRPAMGTVGEGAQEMSTAYKAIKKQAYIQPQAARAAFRLVDMEESKRDDYLRSFNGLLTELKIFMPTDLVDKAEGKDTGSNVVPMGAGKRPASGLVTMPAPYVGDDADLNPEPEAAAEPVAGEPEQVEPEPEQEPAAEEQHGDDHEHIAAE